MGFVTTFLIGFALAMDAFAVSITKGITLRKITTALSFKIAFSFGLFHTVKAGNAGSHTDRCINDI